jgi:hypothetical protein
MRQAASGLSERGVQQWTQAIMKHLPSAILALGTLCAATAFAQTRPTTNIAPLIVQQQQDIIRQQMYDSAQTNAQSILREQAQSQQSLYNLNQRNQQMLQEQAPARPVPPVTIGIPR